MASKVAKPVPITPSIGQPVPPLGASAGCHDRNGSRDAGDAAAALMTAHAQGKRILSPKDFRIVRTLGTGSWSPGSLQVLGRTQDGSRAVD